MFNFKVKHKYLQQYYFIEIITYCVLNIQRSTTIYEESNNLQSIIINIVMKNSPHNSCKSQLHIQIFAIIYIKKQNMNIFMK